MMGGVKNIPAKKNNAYSLKVRNHGEYGELKAIPFVWSIRCGIGTWSEVGLEQISKTCQGAWI